MGLRPQFDFLSPSPEACSSFLSRLVLIFPLRLRNRSWLMSFKDRGLVFWEEKS